MAIKQRETFMEWYETVKDEIFDFRKEIMKYWDSDVDILRRGCLEMRKLFLKIADIDPFRYVTLAGVCMAIYRSKFLKEGTIAIDEDIKQDVYRHPEKIYNPKKFSKKWYGLIKCKVLPPRKLYHPVLPYKKEKLVFSLCKSCSETVKCKHKNEVGKPKSAVGKKKCKECYEIRNKECNHADEERSFIGTWTTTEVKLAIQKGYEILNVYEIWNFNSKSKDLFRDYVKMFLKIKLETDEKWNFKTEEEYRRYVKEKLDMELGKIEKNPGLRFIAKICLNSLWGKFGQRKNMQQTEYVMELGDFYRIVLNDAIKDLNMIFLNDDCVEMQYKMKDEYAKDNFNTNVYVAAFTTSSARIRLYEIMDKLGDKVLYSDTNSIMYIDDGTNTIETGCMLGEWTDELEKDQYIQHWISPASKDYVYRLNNGKVKGKVKGFKMSYESETKLNFEERIKIITGETESIDIKINQFKIQKDRNIKVNTMTKKYMFGFDRDNFDNFD
ncbi:DNA_pol_B_2 domain-containing protein [Trichonephila clavipes]|nr:DNA_pol_B_2 domain-containing protein [Trichonephila clavipes]